MLILAVGGDLFPSWDGRIAALGKSAGGTVVLDAVADAVGKSSQNKPDVTATWSAKMLFADLHTVPNDGNDSEDSCDHARSYNPPPDYDPGRVAACWVGVNHYMDATHTQDTPNCGFGGPDGRVEATYTDVPGDCTSDLQSWHDASPYVSWATANKPDFGPVFIANGGGDYTDPYDYDKAETVAITEPEDFNHDRLIGNGWALADAELCIVDAPKHDSQYEDLPCEGDPEGATVFSDTAAFIDAQLPPAP